jgi:hypothetical protein
MTNAHRISFLGHTDQGGKPDGVQVMVAKNHAYVGHMFSDGITVIDVADPRAPKPVQFIACPPSTRASHIQVHDGLMLAVNAANVWALQQYEKEGDYFGKSLADSFSKRERSFAAGMRVYDLANPAEPREIGFMPIEGIGLHRIWWVGGRYAYASAHFDGYVDHILAVIDMKDPTRPEIVGKWWFPGMHSAGGETPTWGEGKRWALHHMITAGDLGFAAWRDGGDGSEGSNRAQVVVALQLVSALRGRHPHSTAASWAGARCDRGRGDQQSLRERIGVYLGGGCEDAGEPGDDRDAANAERGGLLQQGRQIRAAQFAREPAGIVPKRGTDFRHVPQRRSARFRHQHRA